jgi:hypothetical protein
MSVVSWDGVSLVRRELAPGDHIIVNEGVDASTDPLVPHFAPLLGKLPDPPLAGLSTEDVWGEWVNLLRGDGLAVDDPRALLIRKDIEEDPFRGRVYGSGSAALLALRPDRVRYDFTASPLTPQWTVILP